MPSNPCIHELPSGRLCGKLSAQSRCPAHRTTAKGAFRGPNAYGRDQASHKRFARAVLKRAGHQCQWVDPRTGVRCLVVRPLQAHHLEPGNDDPAKGVALCAGPNGHHQLVDSQARRSRAA